MRHSISILLCLCSTVCLSQDEREEVPKHGMSFELLGTGGLGSAFYEHFFAQKEKRFMTFRMGLGFAPKHLSILDGVNVGLPHGVTINFGRTRNFEASILGNLLFTPDDTQKTTYYMGPALGYRKQTPTSFSRIFLGYYYLTGPESGFFPNLGLALGFPFRKQDL